MPKIFIHIGLPKTGSSYLQNCFEWFEKNHSFKNICYPLIKEKKSFQDIGSGNAVNIGHYLIPRLNPEFKKNELKAKIQFLFDRIKDKTKPILISSEFFSSANSERVIQFKDYLLEEGYEVELIVVVRPLKELLFSSYMQNIKREANEISFKDWIVKEIKVLPINYLKQIRTYALPIHVVEYDKENLLKKTLDILGEDLFLEKKSEEAIVNRSLTKNELQFMLNVNSIFKDSSLATKISNRLIEKFPNRKSTSLTKEESDFLDIQIANISPELKVYNRVKEEEIVNIFLSKSKKTKNLEQNKEEALDSATLNLSLEVIRDYFKENHPLTKQNAIRRKIFSPYADSLRKVAIKIEKYNTKIALDLMTFAQIGRPNGQRIKKKISSYQSIFKDGKFLIIRDNNVLKILSLHKNMFNDILTSLRDNDINDSILIIEYLHLINSYHQNK